MYSSFFVFNFILSALELEIAVHLTELHLAVASLARKLGNLKLAENYLSSEVMWMTNGPSRVSLLGGICLNCDTDYGSVNL